MTHSFAREVELTCPQCGQTFSADVWLIVDAAERPDLLERIREGALHDLPCPHCGHRGAADAPLLVLRPGQERPLLFSPAQGTTVEQDHEQAAGLVGALRERLGDAWQDDWVRQGLLGVQRPMLPVALSDDPEAALRQMDEQAQEMQQTAVAAREALEALPPEERARALLEKMLAQEPVALKTEDLDEVMFRILAGLQAEATPGSEQAQRLTELEARLRQARLETQRLQEPRQVLAAAGVLGQILVEFINTPSWTDSRRIVEEHPDLLSEEVDTVLERLLEVEKGGEASRTLEEHRALLRRCREVGIEAAFSEHAGVQCTAGAGISAPPEFEADLRQAQEAEGRYLRTGDRAALDEAATAWGHILSHAAFAAAPERFQLAALNDRGRVYLRRYSARGRVDDLNQALACLQQAVQRTPPDSPDLPDYLNNLGVGLRSRYARTGELADLEEAIRVFRQAVQRTPSDSPNLPSILTNLGAGLHERYARTGQLADLEEAIRVYQQAVGRTPSDSPDLPTPLTNLGVGLRDRYARTGQLADLEEAIRAFQQAVQRTPPDSPDLPLNLTNLGTGMHDRYARSGQLADLEEAIRVFRQVVQRTPPDSPGLPTPLTNLGTGLHDRYARSGQLADLEEAIRVFRQAVQRTPPDSPGLPARLTNLGVGLHNRYARTGELADLEEAIRASQQAVQRTPSDSPDLPAYLTNLGTGLSRRYARTGELGDLEEAIRVYQQAVQRTPPDSPDLPLNLTNLGVGLRDRYARSGQLADLEEAIRVYQQAVQRTPPDSPDLPPNLTNLGTGLHERYARSGQLADLEEAIRVFQQALQRTPPDSPDLPSILTNLGTGLSRRYAHSGQLADLEEAIRVYQQALQRTPPDSPDLPPILNNLGTGLRDRYARTGQWADLEEAICIYERALTVLDHAFLLSPVAYQLGQQDRWAGLTARAVKVHHQAGRAAQALAIAEGNKSRLLTTLLGRGQIPVPATIPSDLVERERTLVAELVDLDAADLARHGSGAAEGSTLPRRQALVAQLVSLWEEMKGHSPEASDYVALRQGNRSAYEDLAHLAADLGPDTAILSIFTAGGHTLLFVLQAGMDVPEAVDVDLPADELRYTYWANYADEVLNRRVHRAAGRPFTHRWRDLGQRLLARVLPLLEDATHLVIVPEGPFHLLPIHALSLNAARETLLDRFAVSYVPALTVLARLLQREPILAREAAVLGYTSANPATARGHAERRLFLGEAQAVAEQLDVSPLLDQEANSGRLQAVLRDQILRLVHLSCHGGFDTSDPLRSGVLLADGIFAARQWMELHFRADLVTLSACQTGLSGSLGGDEMAGLSQALLYAGASSLLVGLWSVNARTTAALMVDFYRRLWDENGDKRTDKATALREAALALRDGRLLPPMEGVDLSDPYYWAPFILVGDWR